MTQTRGFTLMEVIIAMALLVFGVVAVVKVMSTGLSADVSNDGRVIALKLAQDKMEDVKNTSSALNTTTNLLTSIDAKASSGTFSSPYAAYSWLVTVTDPYNSQTGTAQVTVTVTWTYKGSSRTVSLVSLIA